MVASTVLDELERIGMGELAQAVGVAPSTLTHHVTLLERAGLVVRVACGREVLVGARRTVEIVVHPRPFEHIHENCTPALNRVPPITASAIPR